MLFHDNITLSAGQATATQAPSAADTLITVEDVSKSHDGMRILFEELSFSLASGERMAIIGANGSGVQHVLGWANAGGLILPSQNICYVHVSKLILREPPLKPFHELCLYLQIVHSGSHIVRLNEEVCKQCCKRDQYYITSTAASSCFYVQKLPCTAHSPDAGKTSLLKLLAGTDQPDEGSILVKRNVHVSYLPQLVDLPPEQTALEAVVQSDSLVAATVREYNRLLEQGESVDRQVCSIENTAANAYRFTHAQYTIILVYHRH